MCPRKASKVAWWSSGEAHQEWQTSRSSMLMEGLQCPAGNCLGDTGWWLPNMFEDGEALHGYWGPTSCGWRQWILNYCFRWSHSYSRTARKIIVILLSIWTLIHQSSVSKMGNDSKDLSLLIHLKCWPLQTLLFKEVSIELRKPLLLWSVKVLIREFFKIIFYSFLCALTLEYSEK